MCIPCLHIINNSQAIDMEIQQVAHQCAQLPSVFVPVVCSEESKLSGTIFVDCHGMNTQHRSGLRIMLMTPQKSFVFLVEIKNLAIITSMRPRGRRVHSAPFIISLLCEVTHQPVSEGGSRMGIALCSVWGTFSKECLDITRAS